MRFFLLLPLSALLALPAQAQTQACRIDPAAVVGRLAELEQSYSLVRSDLGCDVPTLPAHLLMCDAALDPAAVIWRMGRLDDLAWVYAMENATGQDVDDANHPLDQDFIARRDACTDEACLCDVLIKHTNDSLGGTSPYPQ